MGSAIDPNEIKRYELTEVYAHPEAKVDIVLVHGLNGHPQKTWTAKNGVFWPSQLLPVTLKSAKARVLVYGYNADVYAFGKGGASSDMIHHHAQTLLANLSLERKSEETSDHPIIWVAHSLGGILVKRALNLSNELKNKHADDLRSIAVSTYGIIFLGTPHTGADPAKWGLMLQGMVSALLPSKIVHTEAQLVKTLQTNNETLQNINLAFNEIYEDFMVCMVHEGIPTDLGGTKRLIVDQVSASPQLPGVQYYGIEATHSDMCKFESKNSAGYTNVAGTIKSWVQDSPEVIETRRERERNWRRQSKEAQAAELLGERFRPSLSQVPSAINTPETSISVSSLIKTTDSIEPEDHNENAPFFIKPSGFRPNSIFVGRQAELAEMHRMLFDKRRRANGTSAILIHSMPGGGKTHLAREYVYAHKEDYPGGIFWVRAKNQTELAAGFWDIARKAALKNLGGKENARAFEGSDFFIKIVKKWLNHRRDWLLVFDGIHFDDSETLRKFIPDSAGTSLIYTSTERSISGNHHFMNPQIIRLPHLSAREAQQLLLLELDKREPFSKDDLKHSMELVQAMGFLPVVIHAVAQRLKSTDEPLSKFARHYSVEPKLRGLEAYKAVVDLLEKAGAIEALNLIYILCFFSQHIPVEMISLGLKALDVEVKANEKSTGHSLNSTFRYLNKFALIDRSEQDYSISSSQSSKSSRDMLADNVDVIRLHSVVQGFFIDTLNADGKLAEWLNRAVGIFCHSYDHANERIARKASAGLVEDYRLYEIHGIRLREHLTRYQKKYPQLAETNDRLNGYLQAIQTEIEERTPESSQNILGGRQDTFQTSIFDRTSSSSDTGPDTPGYEKANFDNMTWKFDPDNAQLESPLSLTHDTEYTRLAMAKTAQSSPRQYLEIPPMEDDGYDSDREGSVAMTLQPSQRTVQQEPPMSPGDWEVVKPRKAKKLERLNLHRTINRMERSRYRDHPGSFRAVGTIDPRVSREFAVGYVTAQRAQFRGRISGQSGAEVALAHLSKQSPPPARGGGLIHDRRPSSQRAERRPMMTGTGSYAAPTVRPTKDTVSGFRDIGQPASEPQETSYDSPFSSLDGRPKSLAMASLQGFPIGNAQSPTGYAPNPIVPMPPYPQSPGAEYQRPSTAQFDEAGLYGQENMSLRPDPYPSTVYPLMTGAPPIEIRQSSLSSSPLKRDLPHDYHAWHSQEYPDSMPSSMHLQERNPSFLSLSSPNIRRPHSNSSPRPSTYVPGRPEFSFPSPDPDYDGGYTSQPMSRNQSGQSSHSHHSKQSASAAEGRGRRRPSLAETEPMPELPVFSPRLPPTSYQVYERMRERELKSSNASEREREPGAPVRKSPRLGYARAALVGSLDEWGFEAPAEKPQQPRKFDPRAASFSPFNEPLPSATPSRSSTKYSSTFSYPSNMRSSFGTNETQITMPSSVTNPNESTYCRPEADYEAPRMGRSGSGGVRVGGRLIEFGDFPDPVDLKAARNRVMQSWNERENKERLRTSPPRREEYQVPVGLGLDLARRASTPNQDSEMRATATNPGTSGVLPADWEVQPKDARNVELNTQSAKKFFAKPVVSPKKPKSADPQIAKTIEAAISQALYQDIDPSEDTSMHVATYQVTWELPTFLAAHMRSRNQLGRALTLTGDFVDAYAVPCKQYLTEYWGEVGDLLLQAIEGMLESTRSGEASNDTVKIVVTQPQSSADRVKATTYRTTPIHQIGQNHTYVSEAKIEVYGEVQDHLDVAAAIMWLSAAIRHSPTGLSTSASSIQCDIIKSRNSIISIKVDTFMRANVFKSSCWHALFDYQAIAEGFKIPERKAGKGLEISFGNMAALAKSMSPVEMDGGLLVEGFVTLLIPTGKLDEEADSAVQWHLAMKPSDGPDPVLSVFTPELFHNLHLKEWYREMNWELLTTQRAFLGWVPEAVVLAGTSQSKTDVGRSGLFQIDDTQVFWGVEAQLGFQFNPAALMGTVTAELSSITPAISNLESLILINTLKNKKRHFAIIYDNDAQIGWHIAQTSLILYLAHIIINERREPFTVSDLQAKAYPEPTLNSPESAFHALDSGSPWELPPEKGISSKTPDPSQTLAWLTKNICLRLAQIEEKLLSTRGEKRKCRKTPKHILGVELLDVAFFDSRCSFKETLVGQTWANLTEEEPLVLFCKNAGQMIVPNLPFTREYEGALCPNWGRIPIGGNYLVAKTSAINQIVTDNTSRGVPRLGKNLIWRFEQERELFELHRWGVINSPCRHTQTLSSGEPKRNQVGLERKVEKWEGGALVFGGGGQLRKQGYTAVAKNVIMGTGNGHAITPILNTPPPSNGQAQAPHTLSARSGNILQAFGSGSTATSTATSPSLMASSLSGQGSVVSAASTETNATSVSGTYQENTSGAVTGAATETGTGNGNGIPTPGLYIPGSNPGNTPRGSGSGSGTGTGTGTGTSFLGISSMVGRLAHLSGRG